MSRRVSDEWFLERYGELLENAMEEFLNSEYRKEDLDKFVSIQNECKIYDDRNLSLILFDRVLACCLHSPTTEKWRVAAREYTQLITSLDYSQRGNVRNRKLRRIRKIRRSLDDIIYDGKERVLPNISAQLISELQCCVDYIYQHENLFVNQSEPDWDCNNE